MGLRIATNLQSINSQRNMATAIDQNNLSMERLASGFRINRASDDAAGLAISERLKANIRSLGAAKRNANDGISLLQTAEGGLNEVGNILVRLRELAVQGASDTIGTTERGFLNKEFSALKEEVTRIARSTEFNGTPLIVGNQEDLPEVQRAGANQYPLDIQVGVNYFKETDGADVATPLNLIRIDLSSINASVGENGLNLGSLPEEGAGVISKDQAQGSISVLDSALTKVAGYRATIGSIQSRLSSTVSNLSVASENASAANSRIRDTDFAEETARLTQSNIIKQAAVSVLSQANAAPQLAVRLLG